MTVTRKTRVPMAEQIRLINECRQSGMTDADWCRENDITVSTFYNWVSRCRKVAANQIQAPNHGHCEIPRRRSQCQRSGLHNGWNGKGAWPEHLRISEISAGTSANERDDRWSARRACTMESKTPIYQKSHVNYSELLQLAKGWSNFISDRIIIWRLPPFSLLSNPCKHWISRLFP